MLTPEQLSELPETIVALFGEVEAEILSDMARRIIKADYTTATAYWQSLKLRELGAIYEEIISKMSSITGKLEKEIIEMFKAAAEQSLRYDDQIYRAAGFNMSPWFDNPYLLQIVQAAADQTSNLFFNLTRTTARTATLQFEKALDFAYMQIQSGAFSYQQAISTAVKNLASKGVASIIYPSGHTDTLEVAVRRAALTGVNQSALRLQDARADEFGCDLVETTAHDGARPEHALWQGQVFSRSGKHKKYPKFDIATGYGTGAGLGGWNCRHSFFPFFEGISERVYTDDELENYKKPVIDYNGKKLTTYDAQQTQREIERSIRSAKREFAATDFPEQAEEHIQAALLLQNRRDRLKDFIAQTGLSEDGFRVFVAGFGRSQASSATWAARRAKRHLTDN